MHVLSLPKVDDINMEFHMDMYFRQFWNDNRLAFSKRASPTSFDKIKHPSLKTRVWVPDPFFVNQKEGKVLDNPADNTLFTIERNGIPSLMIIFKCLNMFIFRECHVQFQAIGDHGLYDGFDKVSI